MFDQPILIENLGGKIPLRQESNCCEDECVGSIDTKYQNV